MEVKPYVVYTIKLEVLRHLTDINGQRTTIFTIDDKTVGDCNYRGTYRSCKFYDCSSELDVKEIMSNSGSIAIKVRYEKRMKGTKNMDGNCACDRQTWDCKETWDKTDPYAVTRITLFPKTHRSGKSFLRPFNAKVFKICFTRL